MGHHLAVELLGRTRFQVDAGVPVVRWPRPSARRLATLLVLADGHRRRREELCEFLFPHLSPDRGARSVSRALSLARSVLGPGVLAADRSNLWIAGDVEVSCDLHALRDALCQVEPAWLSGAAADLFASDPSGLALVDDPYEAWAEAVRADLADRYRAALRAWARNGGGLVAWERLFEDDPTQEDACRRVIGVAADRGDADAIVRAFDRHQTALRTLGLSPSTDLVRTVQRLRAVRSVTPSRRRPIRGRGQELASVIDLLHGVGPGARGRVAIIGPAGVGKTRLTVEVLEDLAGRGWLIGSGTAVRHDAGLPMVALRSALDSLAPEVAAPLATLLPGPGSRIPPVEGRELRLAELADVIDRSLVRLSASQPVLLVLDDVQWVDPTTRSLLERLSARQPRPWAVLLSARTEPAPSTPIAFASSWDVIELGPLPSDAAAQLVIDHAPGCRSETRSDIVERAGGVPLYVIELARHARQPARVMGPDLPVRLRELILERVDALDPLERDLLERIALLGEQATFQVLEAVAPNPLELSGRVRRLEGADLVSGSGVGLRVAHPIVGDVVTSAMPLQQRATMHARMGVALAELRQVDRGPALAAAAHHLFVAQSLVDRSDVSAARVAEIGFRAVRDAGTLLASEVAESLLERALDAWQSADEPDRLRLRRDALGAWITLGDLRIEGSEEAASAAYRRALELASSPMSKARCWMRLAWVPYRRGHLAGSRRLLEQALSALDDDETAAAALRIELAWLHARGGDPATAVGLLERAVVVTASAGEWWWTARGLDRLGSALVDLGELEEGLAALERGVQTVARAEDPNLAAVIRMHMAGALRLVDRLGRAHELAMDAVRQFEALGDRYSLSVAYWVLADIRHRQGDLSGALAARDVEVEMLTALVNDLNLSGAQAHRAILLRALGRDAAAAEADDAADAAAERCGSTHHRDQIRATFGSDPSSRGGHVAGPMTTM